MYKRYKKIVAVRDLSFGVDEATCFSILGPNGAGKTTAVKVIYGKAEADKRAETEVRVFGYDPRHKELMVRSMLGVVPQENNLDTELNVEQNLRIYSRFYGFTGKVASARIDELLEFMELQERRRFPVRALSGGMKRRLVIARALLNHPRLLILDEPTTGLDLQVRQLIWDRLQDLKQSGVTLLLTTHYMEESYQLSDQIMIMHNGSKVLQGAPHQLLKESVEPFVLTAPKMGDEPKVMRGVRFQRAGDRGNFYAHDDRLLQQQAKALKIEEFSIGKTNLDDIFLKCTGGSLGDQQ